MIKVEKYIRSLLLKLIALSFSCVVQSGEIVGKKSSGEWIAGPFAQINIACTQSWNCSTPNGVIHGPDTVVVYSKSESTTGVCNAAGGPVESCNVCAAPKPKNKCEYWLEKK